MVAPAISGGSSLRSVSVRNVKETRREGRAHQAEDTEVCLSTPSSGYITAPQSSETILSHLSVPARRRPYDSAKQDLGIKGTKGNGRTCRN